MPSFFGGFGVGDAIAGAGALANAITGRSAAKAQKEQMRRQSQLIEQQNQLFRQTAPQYQQLVQQLAQRAGLGTPGVTGIGPGHFRAGTPGAITPEDELRMRAAEDDVSRYYANQANQLRHGLGQGGGALGAALTRLGGQQAQQLGQFRRQLAINAPTEQEHRLAQLQGALGFGLGQGGAAAAGYGAQAGMYGQQAAGAQQGINNILQQYAYGQQIRNQPDQNALLLKLLGMDTGTADAYPQGGWQGGNQQTRGGLGGLR